VVQPFFIAIFLGLLARFALFFQEKIGNAAQFGRHYSFIGIFDTAPFYT
jgi:hypothetical protein